MDVKRVRDEQGLTQEELAGKLGVSVATVSRWERGKHKLSKLARNRLKDTFQLPKPS